MRNDRMYAELLELISTDAASGKERLIAEKLREKMQNLGFSVREDEAGKTFGGECGNLYCRREGELSGSLLLCSHMDRVPRGIGIKPVEMDGILYSDGNTILAADDVSGIAAILEGLRSALESGAKLPTIEVLFTVGEEIALYGSTAFDMSWIQSKDGFIFDSPGTIGRVICAAPGMYHLDVEVTGKASHAGNFPEKGIDAAKCVCEMIATLKTGRLDPVSTSNFSVISTGSKARNVVCDFAEFHGEARSHKSENLEAYVAYFEDHCRKVAEKYGAEIAFSKKAIFLPFDIQPESVVCRTVAAACEALGISPRFEPGGGGMDANIFNAKGMSCVGVATGYSGNHTLAEQLILEDFFKSGELAKEIILKYSKAAEGK